MIYWSDLVVVFTGNRYSFQKGFLPFTHSKTDSLIIIYLKFIEKSGSDKQLFYEYCFICSLRYAVGQVEAEISTIVAIAKNIFLGVLCKYNSRVKYKRCRSPRSDNFSYFMWSVVPRSPFTSKLTIKCITVMQWHWRQIMCSLKDSQHDLVKQVLCLAKLIAVVYCFNMLMLL